MLLKITLRLKRLDNMPAFFAQLFLTGLERVIQEIILFVCPKKNISISSGNSPLHQYTVLFNRV